MHSLNYGLMLLDRMLTPDPEKLVKRIHEMVNAQAACLHVAHSFRGYTDKNKYHNLENAGFSKLQRRMQNNEDVTSELVAMKKRLKRAVGCW